MGWLVALLCVTAGCTAPAPARSAVRTHDTTAVAEPVRSARSQEPARPSASPERARPADSLVSSLGLNVHLSYFRTPYGTGWDNIIKPKLIALGVRHLRDHGDVTDNDGWMRTVYGRMGELAAAGIKFDLVLRPTQGSTNYTSIPQFQRLMKYAAPAVEAFEGLNEHDISKRSDWVEEARSFQQALFTTVRADSRTASLPVYGPSMAHARNAGRLGDLSQYMTMGSIHPYPGGGLPMTSIGDHERQGASISGARPFVVTEAGYHTATRWTGDHPGVSEQAQARYLTRLLLDFFDAGVGRTYIYEFIDQGANDADREMSFGILRNDGSEKPAYTALRNLVTILKDPGPAFATGTLGYTLAGDTSNVERTLLQKRDGRFYLVLWQNQKSYDLQARVNLRVNDRTGRLTLSTSARSINLYTPLTSAAAVKQVTGAGDVTLEISDSPLIVEITP